MRRFAVFVVALAEVAVRALGVGEIMLIGGLALVGYGAGLVYAPAGFFVPGAAMLAIVAFGIR